jgi:hypothetical protein
MSLRLRLRFRLSKNRYVIDNLNPKNSFRVYIPSGCEESQECLRINVLLFHVQRLLKDLLRLKQASKPNQLWRVLPSAVVTMGSVLVAIGEVSFPTRVLSRRQREIPIRKRLEEGGIQAFTSLSLFANDLQAIIADLYDNPSCVTLGSVHNAVLETLRACLSEPLRDLWREYDWATSIDHSWYGIGPIPGYGISTEEYERAVEGIEEIALRANAVRAKPEKVSPYTIQFVGYLDKYWPVFKTFKTHKPVAER